MMRKTNVFQVPRLTTQDTPEGFLGQEDPLINLAEMDELLFHPWMMLAARAPELLAQELFHVAAEKLPVFTGTLRHTEDPALWRVAIAVTFLAQSYIWGDPYFPKKPRKTLPAGLAVILHKLARHFGVRPLLIYATYALKNWRRIDPALPISAENVTMLQHFNPENQEERFHAEDWFVAIHVEIEHHARYVLAAMEGAEDARLANDREKLTTLLGTMTCALESMRSSIARMSERCAPATYYQFVRPYLAGWTKSLAPDGVVYEGVNAYKGIPQYFDGQTGAQSSIMPAIDRFLGIPHHSASLSSHLGRMLHHHTPRAHRAYVLGWAKRERFVDKTLSWKALEHDGDIAHALQRLRFAAAMFRREHYILAITHIARPAHTMLGETNPIGTGGSQLIKSLMLHLEETLHPSERTLRMKEFREYFYELLGRPV